MLVAPSILTANFANLKEEIKSISNADYIHLDIMDGNFVPNLSFGPHIAQNIRNVSDIPFDTHLMVLDPVKWIEKFALPNTTYITVHFESNNFKEAIKLIKGYNIKAGLSVKPKTKISEIKHLLIDVDLILVMSVEPGFGGQKFMVEALDKIKELVDIRKKENLDFIIEVDGGVNGETALLLKEAGADMIVAGSYIFNEVNRQEIINKLKNIK